MGGEKSQKSKKVKSSLGSPPRGRGKASPLRPRITRFGITPAWAGKSKAERLSRCAAWDHPRVGGEKRVSVDFFSPFVGSPPRGRGKDQRQAQNSAGGGITPAWAGKRGWMRATEITRKDHPRVGGEKQISMEKTYRIEGSPPRGRGKGLYRFGGWPLPGITPAWAGKRLKRSHRSGIFISGPIPFHSVLHRPAGSGGSRAGRDGAPAGQPQNAGPA